MRSKIFTVIFSTAILIHLIAAGSYAAVTGVPLPADHLKKNGKVTCGYLNGKWESGQLKNGLFISYAARVADLKKSYRKAKGKKRASLKKQIDQYTKARVDQNKKICSKIAIPVATPTPLPPTATATPVAPTATPTPAATATPTVATFSSLKKIPSASNLVKASGQVGASAVSGQPPALIDIPAMDVKALYWEPGLVEGVIAHSSNANQCRDFWFGDQDGESGGMNACNMTGQMGYTFSPIMSAGVSLCYLKALPSQQLFTSGGVQVVSGQIPGADPRAIFDVGLASKVIKLVLTGPQQALIYARIHSGAENAQSGYQYHADIWQCGNQSNQAILRHSVVVTSDHQYQYGFYSHEDDFNAGGHQFTVEAGLALDGDGTPGFDLTRDRHAVAEFQQADGTFGFRQDIRITPENLLKIKSRWLFPYGWRKDYSVSRFSGTGIRDLRLREGGIKAEDHNDGEPQNDSVAAMEYRDTAYVAAPANALAAEATALDFNSDTFLSTPPSVSIDTAAFLCDVVPDVTLQVHTDNPEVATLFANCEQYTIWDTNFCAQDNQLNQAQQQWGTFCPGVIAGG